MGFADPRERAEDPREVGLGPLPEALGRWEGILLSEAGAILTYHVGEVRVLEKYSAFKLGEEVAMSRVLRIGPHEKALTLVLDETGQVEAHCKTGEVGMLDGRLVVRFAPQTEETDHVVVIAPRVPGDGDAIARVEELAIAGFEKAEVPAAARWPEVITTKGTHPETTDAFVIDEIALPVPNPWKRNVRLSGLDFFSDGRAALSTFDGDVWIVSGIDDSLGEVK